MKNKKQKFKKDKNTFTNEKGVATLEAVPLLLVFLMLLSYMLGFFGAIHSGILNSIAARTYAHETFRNRTHLVYFREDNGGSLWFEYYTAGARVHGIGQSNTGSDVSQATPRQLAFGPAKEPINNTESYHNDDLTKGFDKKSRLKGQGVNPIWIKTAYGICIRSQCE